MLADEIIASYETGMASAIMKNEGSAKIIDNIKAARKFCLTEDTFQMAEGVRKSKPESVLSSIAFSNPPFPLTWIEYTKTTAIGKGDLIDAARDYEEAPTIKRLGFLIEEIDSKWMIHMGYSYKDGQYPTTINLLAHVFDRSMNQSMIDELREFAQRAAFGNFIEEDAKKEVGSAKLAQAMDKLTDELYEDMSKKEREVSKKIGQMFLPIPSPYFIKTWMGVKEKLGDIEFLKVLKTCEADWWGEVFMPVAVCILMNCKNATEVKDCEPLETLNKRRQQRGVLPIMEYKILDITEKVKRNLCVGDKEEKGIHRMHWRRGHFKIRKTGVYWWEPHLAGNAELGMIEKDYVV